MWWPPCQQFLKTLVEVSKHRNTVFMLFESRPFSNAILWYLWKHTMVWKCIVMYFMLNKPFLSPESKLPRLELVDTLLLGVHNKHQVISIEKLPWHPGAELKEVWDGTLLPVYWYSQLVKTTSVSCLVSSTPSSPATFSISVVISDGPTALLHSILLGRSGLWTHKDGGRQLEGLQPAHCLAIQTRHWAA